MVLAEIAEASPRDLLKRNGAGQSFLSELVTKCQSQRLIKKAMLNDVDKLYAIFDVAAESGLSSFIYDYVVEVCFDKYFASNDPLEAYLFDGQCVKQWCERSLADIRHILDKQPTILQDRARIASATSRLSCLVLILETLHRSAQSSSSSQQQPVDLASRSTDDLTALEQARTLEQLCKVATWFLQARLHAERPTGRYASEQEWKTEVNKRRDASQPVGPFLRDILQRLKPSSGVDAVQYPPSSQHQLLMELFGRGASDNTSWNSKLSLLVYYILDAGFAWDPHAFSADMRVPLSDVATWQAQYLVDQAMLLGGNSDAAKEAALILTGIASGQLPLKFIQAMLKLDRQDVALMLARVWQLPTGSAVEAALPQAQLLQSVRLQSGMVLEAYLEGRRWYDRHAACCDELMQKLAQWCLEEGKAGELLQLPLSDPELRSVQHWLEGENKAGRCKAAKCSTLMSLARGDIVAAQNSWRRHATHVDPGDSNALCVSHLLETASGFVPAALRQLSVGEPTQGRPLLLSKGAQEAEAAGKATPAVPLYNDDVARGTAPPRSMLSIPHSSDLPPLLAPVLPLTSPTHTLQQTTTTHPDDVASTQVVPVRPPGVLCGASTSQSALFRDKGKSVVAWCDWSAGRSSSRASGKSSWLPPEMPNQVVMAAPPPRPPSNDIAAPAAKGWSDLMDAPPKPPKQRGGKRARISGLAR